MSYNDAYGSQQGNEGRRGFNQRGYNQEENIGHQRNTEDDNDGRRGFNQQDQSEYGGGGRGSDNYYNKQSSYNDEPSGRQGGSHTQQHGDNEYQGALSHAQQHSTYGGDAPEESSLFSNALGFLSGNKQKIVDDDDIDESQAIRAHKALYGGGNSQQQHSSETVGAGAAMQALKLFTGGGAGGGGTGSHGGGNSQNQFIGMAMAQASSLFDQQSSQGKVVSKTFYSLLPCMFSNPYPVLPILYSLPIGCLTIHHSCHSADFFVGTRTLQHPSKAP